MVFLRYMKIRGVLILVGILFFSVFYHQPAFAQFGDLGSLFGGNDGRLSPIPQFGNISPGVGGLFEGLTLIASPNYPEPYETFDVALNAPDEDYSGAIIKWYINGTEDLVARNQRTHTLTAGALGEKMTIRTTLEKQSGGVDEKTLVITPVKVDIIIEADTMVPSFYNGRALPSRGSKARATAIIHTANKADRNNLTYRWELNGDVLESGAIRGLNTVDFEMPLGFESYIDVTISNSGGVIGRKSLQIIPAEPEILFYEENPLLGIVPAAFAREKVVLGNQITVRAEPYYLDSFKTNPKYLVEWSLNNRKTDNSGSFEPNLITLRSDGTTSQGNVFLRMADLSKLSTPTSNSFYLKFGF
jgi:hypothetical protein